MAEQQPTDNRLRSRIFMALVKQETERYGQLLSPQQRELVESAKRAGVYLGAVPPHGRPPIIEQIARVRAEG